MSDKSLNSKYVIFSLVNGTDKLYNATGAIKSVSNPKVFELESIIDDFKNTQQAIINTLRQHVIKYGTLNELIISGHGNSQIIASGDKKYRITIPVFINAIGELEKEVGKKISNRIVFAGCLSFSNLNEKRINFYRYFADKHNVEIVGTTSLETAFSDPWELIKIHAGRYVQFSPTGEVSRDKLDTRYNPLALGKDDRSWIDDYLGDKKETWLEKLAVKLKKHGIIDMVEDVEIKTHNLKPLDGDGCDLVDRAHDLLDDKSWFFKNILDKEDQSVLEKMDVLLKDAKIIVHKDGKGATVLSGAGAAMNIGGESLIKKYNEMNTGEKQAYNQTTMEFAHVIIEATKILKPGIAVTNEKRQQLERLDEVLKDVIIMVTEDDKGIMIADSNCNHFELGTAKENQISKKR